MILRTRLAIGAILFFQSIAFGSNFARANEVNDKPNLRGVDHQKEDTQSHPENRELRPYGFGRNGRGFGFTTNNNRFSVPRVAGNGSQRLRPYAPQPLKPYAPNRGKIGNVPPPPRQPAMSKGKGTKKHSYYYYTKSHKAHRTNRPRQQVSAQNGGRQPQRGRGGYLNSMNWQRVPGQPLFVSNTELPTVLILDEPPTLVVDNFGNNILVDGDGNEIVIGEDEDGNVVVSVVVGSDGTDGTDESSTPSPTTTPIVTSGDNAAAFPLRPPTENPTATPTLSPTKSPTDRPSVSPTPQPTINPTKVPTGKPSRPPTMNPTAKPTNSPTEKPTNSPTAAGNGR